MKKLEKLTLELEKEIKGSLATGETDFKKISKLQTEINELRDKKMDAAIKKQDFGVLHLPSGRNDAHLSYLLDKYEKKSTLRSFKRKTKWMVGGVVSIFTIALIRIKIKSIVGTDRKN